MDKIVISEKEAFNLLKYLRFKSESIDIDAMTLCKLYLSPKGEFIGFESSDYGFRYISKSITLKAFIGAHYKSMIYRDVYNLCIRHMSLV